MFPLVGGLGVPFLGWGGLVDGRGRYVYIRCMDVDGMGRLWVEAPLVEGLGVERLVGGDPAKVKLCARCKVLKPLEEFYGGANGVAEAKQSYCKVCMAAVAREAHLKWTYGLTPKGYEERLAKQGGTCALCPATTTGHQPSARGRGPKGRLQVEHNHETDVVRGLVCQCCNDEVAQVEAMLRMSLPPERMQEIVEYLKATDPSYGWLP